MKVYLPGKSENSDGTFSGTTAVEAELDEATIKRFKLGPALKRLGRALAEQQKGKRPAKGVEFHRIAFTYILDT